jgi:hypothetical protein
MRKAEKSLLFGDIKSIRISEHVKLVKWIASSISFGASVRKKRTGKNWIPILPCRQTIPFYIRGTIDMTKQQILELYFLDARHKLIELAAFLDRVERAPGLEDFRLKSFRAALAKLNGKKASKAKTVLLAFSDPTTKPAPKAAGKGAVGAWPEAK